MKQEEIQTLIAKALNVPESMIFEEIDRLMKIEYNLQMTNAMLNTSETDNLSLSVVKQMLKKIINVEGQN